MGYILQFGQNQGLCPKKLNNFLDLLLLDWVMNCVTYHLLALINPV